MSFGEERIEIIDLPKNGSLSGQKMDDICQDVDGDDEEQPLGPTLRLLFVERLGLNEDQDYLNPRDINS